MKDKLQVLRSKIETTYNVDPTPADANTLAVFNVDWSPLEQETDDHDPVSDTFGQEAKILGANWGALSFDTLLCGGGAANTPPSIGPLWRSCAMAQTVNGSTSVDYTFVSRGEESVAHYFWRGDARMRMLGARGTAELKFDARKAAMASFKYTGLALPMIDENTPAATLPTNPRPLAVNKNNTVITIGGITASVSSFSAAWNNDVQYRNLMGKEEVVIVDRQLSGKCVIELPAIATQNFLGANGICTVGTEVPIVVTHGTAGGNIITLTLSKTQLLKPKLRAENGITMLECDIHIIRSSLNKLTYS